MTFEEIKSKYESGELTSEKAIESFSERRKEIHKLFEEDLLQEVKTLYESGKSTMKAFWNSPLVDYHTPNEKYFQLEKEADDCESYRLQIIYEQSKKNISDLLDNLEAAKKENKSIQEINFIKNKIAELIDSKIKELEETKQKILNS